MVKSKHTARMREVLYMSRLFCKNSFWMDGYMELRKLKKRHWSSLLRYYILCKHSFVDWEKHMLGKQKYSSFLYGKRTQKNPCVLYHITALSKDDLGDSNNFCFNSPVFQIVFQESTDDLSHYDVRKGHERQQNFTCEDLNFAKH